MVPSSDVANNFSIVCVCTYAHMHIQYCVCTCTHAHAAFCVCTCAHVHIQHCVYMCASAHTALCVYMHAHAHTCLHLHFKPISVYCADLYLPLCPLNLQQEILAYILPGTQSYYSYRKCLELFFSLDTIANLKFRVLTHTKQITIML